MVLQGRYCIETLLDTGGMGEVYLARHTRLNVPVAVKVARPAEGVSGGAATRLRELFEREAQTLAVLDHPNIAKVTDFFEEHDKAFLVMEFVEGLTLHEHLLSVMRRPLHEKEAWTLTVQLLSALEYIHSRTPPVVMRDLKPANVMISSDGRIRLIDFGIAKTVVEGQATHTASHFARSEGYAPLEQYGGTSDTRTDYYALGATLYFMLTARHPPSAVDRATSQADLLDPRSINPTIGTKTWEAVQRLMAQSPAARPQTTAEITALLAPAGAPPPVRMFAPRDEPTGEMRGCPRCGRLIQSDVTRCRWCLARIAVESHPAPDYRIPASSAPLAPTIPEAPVVAAPDVAAPPVDGSQEIPCPRCRRPVRSDATRCRWCLERL